MGRSINGDGRNSRFCGSLTMSAEKRSGERSRNIEQIGERECLLPLKRFILTHSFRDFTPWSLGSIVFVGVSQVVEHLL
jgi:c-di-AMP phosphodiesterase-like protein